MDAVSLPLSLPRRGQRSAQAVAGSPGRAGSGARSPAERTPAAPRWGSRRGGECGRGAAAVRVPISPPESLLSAPHLPGGCTERRISAPPGTGMGEERGAVRTPGRGWGSQVLHRPPAIVYGPVNNRGSSSPAEEVGLSPARIRRAGGSTGRLWGRSISTLAATPERVALEQHGSPSRAGFPTRWESLGVQPSRMALSAGEQGEV